MIYIYIYIYICIQLWEVGGTRLQTSSRFVGSEKRKTKGYGFTEFEISSSTVLFQQYFANLSIWQWCCAIPVSVKKHSSGKEDPFGELAGKAPDQTSGFPQVEENTGKQTIAWRQESEGGDKFWAACYRAFVSLVLSQTTFKPFGESLIFLDALRTTCAKYMSKFSANLINAKLMTIIIHYGFCITMEGYNVLINS